MTMLEIILISIIILFVGLSTSFLYLLGGKNDKFSHIILFPFIYFWTKILK
jgi:hypothetical protein